MSKKYKGKRCAYCGVAESATADHVLAREFFLRVHRADLPQVPACQACNEKKARLEHYLTTVLPFGARHGAARENLIAMVPRRLARNAELHRTLRENWGSTWANEGGAHTPVSTLPVNARDFERLFEYIVRGLIVFHWNTYLGAQDTVRVMALTRAGEEYFDGLLALNAARRIRANVGNGTFLYEGAQAVDLPEITVWRIECYGGVKVADPAAPGEAASRIGALTGPATAAGS